MNVVDTGDRYILLSICEFFGFYLGSLGCARSAQQNRGGYVASTRNAYLNISFEIIGERARQAHQENS
jgi:hypothetical protein